MSDIPVELIERIADAQESIASSMSIVDDFLYM